jgi:hypothetical protein
MGVLGLGREAHFAELNDPLDSQEGVLSPSVRKARAAANLGIILASATGGADVFRGTSAVATATDTATLTTAQVLNGIIHGTPTAAAAYTLPTAAALDTALPDFAVGDAFEFSIVNLATTATFDITVTTNTGLTLTGPMVVGAGANDGAEWKSGRFRARKTGTGAWTVYRVL